MLIKKEQPLMIIFYLHFILLWSQRLMVSKKVNIDESQKKVNYCTAF